MNSLLYRTGAVFFLGLSMLSVANAYTLTLKPQQWYLISTPGDPGLSVAELFDGQLDAADYAKTWQIYPFDEQRQQYDAVDIDSAIRPGAAFWFWHGGTEAISVEVALDATTVPLTMPVFCSSPFGCFEWALPVGNDYQWSLIGTPFPEGISISDIKLVTSAGQCETGCSMEQAVSENLVYGTLFDFDAAANEYRLLTTDDMLEAGEGYWLATAIGPELGPAYLLFPTFCTPFN